MNSFYTAEELKEFNFKSIGTNVLISRKASIYAAERMSIGNNVRIDDFCILSGTIELGDYIHIAAYTALYGGNTGVIFKDFVGISSRCVFYAESDDYSGRTMSNPMVPDEFKTIFKGQVILEKHVLVGTNCSVLPNVTIGEGVALGSMSLVNKDLSPWSIYAGIPAKRIKEREKELLKLESEFLCREY